MIIETCPQESGTTTSGKHSSYPQTQPALLGFGYAEKKNIFNQDQNGKLYHKERKGGTKGRGREGEDK